jgi:hypothetical protein
MKKLILLLSVCLSLFSCEMYVTPNSDVTLSGKYVVSKLDITNVDQNQTRDSLYLLGTTFFSDDLRPPFNQIQINRFYIHMDYSTIRMGLIRVLPSGQDVWKYGNSPNEIFYRILNNNSLNKGTIQFNYITDNGSSIPVTLHIEHDGYEDLQLKSSGGWFRGRDGQKQVMTLYLTRVGP